MPSHRKQIEEEPLEGAGPFRFDSPQLAPGESWYIDLAREERNGRVGGFRKYLPFDQAQITNRGTSAEVDVTYNGVFEQLVVANGIESFDQAGVVSIRVSNPSSNSETLDAGDVVIEVVKDPYDADKRARDQALKGPVANVVEKFTGLNVGGGGGW